eukprot:GHVN01007580.1.p1 GENE.GHVN01007580.1~~GHVN01007580.1.p1  ORF type:complete len:117 (+),score=3.03 GHVN01007580.1:390-740(+)
MDVAFGSARHDTWPLTTWVMVTKFAPIESLRKKESTAIVCLSHHTHCERFLSHRRTWMSCIESPGGQKRAQERASRMVIKRVGNTSVGEPRHVTNSPFILEISSYGYLESPDGFIF